MTVESSNNWVGKLIQSVIAILTQDWKAIGTLITDTYHFFTRDNTAGVFEVLDYDDTLELMDQQGKLAIMRRRMKVRFLQDRVIAFQDYAWGDGNQLADYKISPGRVVDTYKDSGVWNILISLREMKNRGDVVEFNIERTIKNGFTKEIEWRQTEIWIKFHHIRLSVIFPNNRLCKRAVLNERGSKRNIVLDTNHINTLPDGRQVVVWAKDKPRRSEAYTIRWEW